MMFDRHLSPQERAADLSPDLVDAILRVEGIFDPTRVGAFGPALRMAVRPGTAFMMDVSSERWRRADDDPNMHYRVKFLAQAWLAPRARACDDFRRFRPNELGVMLDQPTALDCIRLSVRLRGHPERQQQVAAVVAISTTLPIFAAPYPGSRFSPSGLKAVMDARVRALQGRNWLTRPSR